MKAATMCIHIQIFPNDSAMKQLLDSGRSAMKQLLDRGRKLSKKFMDGNLLWKEVNKEREGIWGVA